MPLTYHIDQDRRIVTATLSGVLTLSDMIGYQREVWTRSDLAGYHELVDMTGVVRVADDSTRSVELLASIASGLDSITGPSRLAIVAQSDYHYGMGRMYKAVREGHLGSVREVEVFRSLDDAKQWIERQSETDRAT